MHFYSTSTQWSVGQGFFHSGILANQSGREDVVYVFDCGSLPKYDSALLREIGLFRKRHTTRRRRIDLIFLSHFHVDHVSGFERLVTGLKIGRLIAPLLPAADRLLCFANALRDDPDGGWPSWYPDLITDPVGTMANFVPESDTTWIRIPDLESPPVPPVLAESVTTDSGGESESGRLTLPEAGVGRPNDEARSFFTPPSASAPTWMWVPWVQPTVAGQALAFETELLRLLPPHLHDLDDTSVLVDIVTNHQSDLVKAYKLALKSRTPKGNASSDLNLTSLSLYSGPAVRDSHSWRVRRINGKVVAARAEVQAWGIRVGWLGTGDGELRAVSRAGAFNRFFADLKSQVGTFAIPHHGSDASWNDSLLEGFAAPPVCVIGADSNGKWRHPSHWVVQSVNSHGSVMLVATSCEPSRWTDAALTRV